MSEDDFIRLFLSEHVIGATQIIVKKMQEVKQIATVEMAYLPASFLYPIATKAKKKRGQKIQTQAVAKEDSASIELEMMSRSSGSSY